MLNEEEKQAIEELSLKSITSSSLETKDYPNMICFKKDVITVLNLITKLQKENEEKDKIIDLMAEYIEKITVDMKIAFGENMLWDRNEIKQYFEQKATNNG